MVFSSFPIYLDPSNWQQQPNQQAAAGSNESPHLSAFPASNHHVAVGGGGTDSSSSRHGSMADRARLAKLPQPEAALQCPRCESTNTKFCYYNNYNLSQPRHLCKTCRRYWTKGGALRNVPVGGRCRPGKKKSKSQISISKSSVSSERQVGSRSTSTISTIPLEIINRLPQQTTHHHLHHQQRPFTTSLQNLTQFVVENFGLNFSTGASGQTEVGFQMGISNSGMSNSSIGVQQFPLVEPVSTDLYPLQIQEGGVEAMTSSSRVSQSVVPVKIEENKQGLNIPIRPFLSIPENNQYWSGNPWTDLYGLNSSSASHL